MPYQTVHPHARGEHGALLSEFSYFFGSSPRPWGTLSHGRGRRSSDRFIPTPVGNTCSRLFLTPTVPVHPHARGEHIKPLPIKRKSIGSSPRPWGTPQHRQPPLLQGRFIPTPVGNTFAHHSSPNGTAVHPHARGEHYRSCRLSVLPGGSSPRPWGTLNHYRSAVLARRFIPTPVGNTRYCERQEDRISVHPHARGEHPRCGKERPLIIGSSPRPWGTRSHSIDKNEDIRFIPTPVGNTKRASLKDRATAVHPHARGEHDSQAKDFSVLNGSSPRPWGTRTSRTWWRTA